MTETKAVHLHYCKKNDSRKQLLGPWYLLTAIWKSLWVPVRKHYNSLPSIVAFSVLKQRMPSQPAPKRKQQWQVGCTRWNEIFLAHFLLLSPLSPIIRQRIIIKNTRLKHNYPQTHLRTPKSANVTNKWSYPLQDTAELQTKA